MRLLVTGATGFLGSHIARALRASGHRVAVLRRQSSPTDLIQDLEVDHRIGDLFDPSSLQVACHGIEVVVHCAAEMRRSAGRDRRLASHLEGTRNLLAAARTGGVRRFVYISSVAALGFPDQIPAESDDGVRPMDETQVWRGDPRRWAYGYTKHLAELAVQRAGQDGMQAVIVNPALVIGPGDRNRVSNLLVWHMLQGRIPPLVAGGVNVVDVADVAEATAAAVLRSRPGERYLLCGENRTLADLIQATAGVLGTPSPRLRLPLGAVRALATAAALAARLLRLPIHPDLLRAVGLYFYYDGMKARREFDLGPPRPYEPAAAASADWYRRQAKATRAV